MKAYLDESKENNVVAKTKKKDRLHKNSLRQRMEEKLKIEEMKLEMKKKIEERKDIIANKEKRIQIKHTKPVIEKIEALL